MAVTQIGALIDAVVAVAATAVPAGTLVLDGLGVTADPADNVLFVGVDDPDATNGSFAADVRQEWANANYTARDEDGYILCVASAWNGDANQKAARDSALAIVHSVENALRANPSLGLPNLLWTSVGGRIALSQNQSQGGAHSVFIFRINYRARI